MLVPVKARLVDREHARAHGSRDARPPHAHLVSRSTHDLLDYSLDMTRRCNRASCFPLLTVFSYVFAEAIDAAPSEARGFHGAGMADASGFAAMGCDEILVHGNDMMSGLRAAFIPPEDLCERVLRRLFPWAPADVAGWSGLLWANGRIALDAHGRVDDLWYWHSAPLETWDGTVKRRVARRR